MADYKEKLEDLKEKQTFTLPKGVWYVIGLLALVGGVLFISQCVDCACPAGQEAQAQTETQAQ